MDLRDAALGVLDGLEQHLLKLRDDSQPVRLSATEAGGIVAQQLAALRALANRRDGLIDAGREPSSRNFLAEIRRLPDPQLLQKLAERDATVICWRVIASPSDLLRESCRETQTPMTKTGRPGMKPSRRNSFGFTTFTALRPSFPAR